MAHTRPPAQERHSLRLGDRGRMVLPAEVRHRLDLKEGDRLILSVEAVGTLLLQGAQTLAQRLQGMFADLAPGVDLADELLADRRAEAGRRWEATGQGRILNPSGISVVGRLGFPRLSAARGRCRGRDSSPHK